MQTSRRLLIGLMVISCCGGLAEQIWAVTFTVCQDGSGDYTTIQAAINAASDNTEIVVCAGTYKENVDFLTRRIVLRSTSPTDPAVVAGTIIDGDIDSNPATLEGPTVTIAGGQGRETLLTGFTITGGTGRLDGGLRWGGGVYVANSGPTLTRLRIHDNHPQFGGGVFCKNGSPLIACSVIAGNTVSHAGGGLQIAQSPGAVIVDNLIINNTAGGSTGGGIDLYQCGAGPLVRNNSVVGNSAPANQGGGIAFDESQADIRNNVIAFNTNGGLSGFATAAGTINYNDLWSNTGGDYQGTASAGPADISQDPLFVDRDGPDNNSTTWQDNDYHLQTASPCINMGDPALVPEPLETDIDGEWRVILARVDIGADEHRACSSAVSPPGVVLVNALAAGLNNGKNWCDAYTDLQDALDHAASSGGEVIAIWVAAGIYKPSEQTTPGDPRSTTFHLVEGVTLYGGFPAGGGAWEERTPFAPQKETVLSGDHNSDDYLCTSAPYCICNHQVENAYHVVAATGLSSDSALDGFTVSGGSLDQHPTNTQNAGAGILGGMGARPTLRNCLITRNRAWGARGVGVFDCDGPIANCRIERNVNCAEIDGAGGGLYGCDGPITNCHIARNTGGDSGGGLYDCDGDITRCSIEENFCDTEGYGGGLAFCDGRITACTISANRGGFGGGLGRCNGVIAQCLISDNETNFYGVGGLQDCDGTIASCVITRNWGKYYGGGLGQCDGMIVNCLITNNTAEDSGGGLHRCNGFIVNCTVSSNRDVGYDGAGGLYECSGSIVNSVVWGNTSGGIASQLVDCSVPSYSCIQGWTDGTAGVGNTGSAPEFVDAANGDFHLLVSSPCINTGDPDFVPEPDGQDIDGDNRVLFGRIDMGADEATYLAHSTIHNITRGTAHLTIQEAINAAAPGDEIEVGSGTYYENVHFGGKDIVLRGMGIENPQTTSLLIAADPVEPIITFSGAESPACCLEGFSVTGGGHGFDWPHLPLSAVVGQNTHATILSCRVFGNNCDGPGGLTGCNGRIEKCVIENNYGDEHTGGMAYCNGQITRCVITGNHTCWGGFGATAMYQCNGLISDCIIAFNTEDCSGYGPKAAVRDCVAQITNCTIVYNTSALGIGIGLQGGSCTITNSIVWGHHVEDGPDPQIVGDTHTVDYSCIQGLPQIPDESGNIGASPAFEPLFGGIWTTVDGNWPATFTDTAANWDDNELIGLYVVPRATDSTAYRIAANTSNTITVYGNNAGAQAGDNYMIIDDALHLSSNSPCINAGDPGFVPEPDGKDIDGDNRVLFGRVDMGADEATYLAHSTIHNITRSTAHLTIQQAIDAAQTSDEIVIDPGRYTGLGNRDINYHGKGITVRGTAPEDPATVEATIIDCQDLGRGFMIPFSDTGAPVISGLTITNGRADYGGGLYDESGELTVTNCVFSANLAWYYGGGISASNLTVIDCTFRENLTGHDGGAVYSGGNLMVTDSVFSHNFAEDWGGGIHSQGTAVITGCLFEDNSSAGEGGGAISNRGHASITDCTFVSNSTSYEGGGIASGYYCPTCSLVVVNSIFIENNGSWGGGIYDGADNATIEGCLVVGNRARYWGYGGIGGGIFGGRTLVNCTLVANSADRSGGGINGSADLTMTNCIVWDNTAEDHMQVRGTPSISCSDIQGGWEGEGNIDANPLFMDPGGPDDDPNTWADNDYHLRDGSPCIDAGDPDYTPEPAEKDIDGEPRVQHCRIDMGADETPSDRPCCISAVSRKPHSGAGEFDISFLDTENRTGGPTRLVVTFDGAIQGVGGLDSSDVWVSSGEVTGVSANGNDLTIGLTGVIDASLLTVEFPGIEASDSPGSPSTDTQCVPVLLGDATNDRVVNIFDLITIRNKLNQPVDGTTFRNDVTADGAINIFDLIATRNNLNQVVAACP